MNKIELGEGTYSVIRDGKCKLIYQIKEGEIRTLYFKDTIQVIKYKINNNKGED